MAKFISSDYGLFDLVRFSSEEQAKMFEMYSNMEKSGRYDKVELGKLFASELVNRGVVLYQDLVNHDATFEDIIEFSKKNYPDPSYDLRKIIK